MNPATLTTGQASRLSGLSPNTIQRCIDQGHLEGFRVPMSNHRRVTPAALAKFLAANGMPMPEELKPYSTKGIHCERSYDH